mmetsp:Transcript_29907/g.36417  ORF Transcript_29907/g.36417 Transcript_29907/m.36417 type:complete len:162 (+) Transcript_29907:99-584(+)
MEDRKARLAALKARATAAAAESNTEENNEAQQQKQQQEEEQGPAPVLKFRNYTPKDVSLEAEIKDSIDDADIDVALTNRDAKRQKISEKSDLERALADAAATPGDMFDVNDVSSMVPKKVNWDLKRNISTKLDKLERRTQRVIVELLRERLEREAAMGDLD